MLSASELQPMIFVFSEQLCNNPVQLPGLVRWFQILYRWWQQVASYEWSKAAWSIGCVKCSTSSRPSRLCQCHLRHRCHLVYTTGAEFISMKYLRNAFTMLAPLSAITASTLLGLMPHDFIVASTLSPIISHVWGCFTTWRLSMKCNDALRQDGTHMQISRENLLSCPSWSTCQDIGDAAHFWQEHANLILCKIKQLFNFIFNSASSCDHKYIILILLKYL